MTVTRPILVDISRMVWRRWSGRQPTGIDRACIAYLEHFGRNGNAHAVVQRGGFTRVLKVAQSQHLIDLVLDGRADFRSRAMPPLLRVFASAPRRAFGERGALYLNVGHTGLDLPGHARWVRSSGVRAVYYIHDIIPITHPEYCRDGEADRHRQRMHAALALAGAIITNSKDSAQALADFAVSEGLAMPPHLVTPLGLSINLTAAVEAPLNEPYFLMIGTIEGRKNHGLVLEAWRRLAMQLGDATPKLILIGARGWAADEIFAMLDTDPVLRRFVVERGQCSDRELVSYLRYARALLFPSFVEGQGLPLMEALAAGTPVIASDLAVFREAAGDIPDYLPPWDVEAWTRLLLDYSRGDSPGWTDQQTRLARFAPPTWAAHFSDLRAWLGHPR